MTRAGICARVDDPNRPQVRTEAFDEGMSGFEWHTSDGAVREPAGGSRMGSEGCTSSPDITQAARPERGALRKGGMGDTTTTTAAEPPHEEYQRVARTAADRRKNRRKNRRMSKINDLQTTAADRRNHRMGRREGHRRNSWSEPGVPLVVAARRRRSSPLRP